MYGIKGDGSAWAEAIHKFMRGLGFQTCIADADVWIISAVYTSSIKSGDFTPKRSVKNLASGERYWEYALICVDCFYCRLSAIQEYCGSDHMRLNYQGG